MDVLSILGFILAVGLVMFGMTFDQESMRIVYHNLKAFLDIPSMAITIGGTLGVMMISFPAGAFKKIGSHLKIIVKPYQYSPTDSVDQIVNLATEARMKGLLSLEDKLNEIDEPFLHNSLMLVVDSVDSEKVRKAMETELEQLDERHALDRRFYEKAACLWYDWYTGRTDSHAGKYVGCGRSGKGHGSGAYNHFIRFTAGQRGLPAHGKQAESAARRGISVQTAGHGGSPGDSGGRKSQVH